MSARIREAGRGVAAAVTGVPGVRRALRALATRGALPAPVWQRLPGPDRIVVDLPGAADFTWWAGPRNAVARMLFWRGEQSDEAATLVPFVALASGAGLAVDVGANTGVYTLAALAADPGIRVLAFEPVASSIARLRENLRLNGFESRAELRACAVSDRDGTARFHVPFGTFPASARLGSAGFRGLAGRLIDVEVVALDGIELDTPISLLKIDTEGNEHLVLAGAQELLARDRPAIVLECNPDGPVAEIDERLRPYGYEYYWLSGAGPVAMDELVPDREERFRNYAAVVAEDPRRAMLAGWRTVTPPRRRAPAGS